MSQEGAWQLKEFAKNIRGKLSSSALEVSLEEIGSALMKRSRIQKDS